MVNNLRILSVNAVSNVLVKVSFTDTLTHNIGIDNVSIVSLTAGVPSPAVLKTRVVNNTFEITCRPFTSLAAYNIIFASTPTNQFKSLNGTAVLFEDGIGNKGFFTAPLEETNGVKDYFLDYLRNNVYNTEDGTIINSYLNVISSSLSAALNNIREARNDNYLSVTITDEPKTRGAGAFDRLGQEGAYEIMRVGRTRTGANTSLTISVDEFTKEDPVSLLQSTATESLTINSNNRDGTFNINGLLLNLSKKFVIKINSVVFTYSNGHLPYEYDISSLGYQILDARYDHSYAFKYFTLENNQIKLSDKVLEDGDFSTDFIFQVQVSYLYKDTGRVLDPTTIDINTLLSSGREVLPPLKNIFNLKHGPVVNNNNVIGSIGDIAFVNQNTLPILDEPHPAFLVELKYRLDFLPSAPGEYSIDYETGTVYVFGADSTNDGTGATPPLAIYNYQLQFKEDIDWVFDESLNDLVALPAGSLIGLEADITFKYEHVLAQDIDYKAQIHTEALDERIENRLVSLNTLVVEHPPITNVFRVFNETTGEIYRPTRWNNEKVYFNYTSPPRLSEILAERASFEEISNEVMFVDTILSTTNPVINVFKIVLNNNNIMAQSEDCIGSSFNSTLSPSNGAIFATELYYNSLLTEEDNLTRLTVVGDYFANYADGIIYVAVSSAQDFNIGSVSYKRGYIKLVNPHITSIEDIYYRINTLSGKEEKFTYIEFEDGLVLPATLDLADEQVLSDDAAIPYLLSDSKVSAVIDGTIVPTVSNNIQFIRSIFEITDLTNNSQPLNFAEAATFDNKIITVGPLAYNEYHTVEQSGSDLVIYLNTGLQYLSANITFDQFITRLSDSQTFTVSSIVMGANVKLILSGAGTPVLGDSVLVNYSYTINDLSHLVVDYNKGEYYIDYTALTDEIIVSYEYGDNSLDFRESGALNAGETYYVSYKVGALRNALLSNFGSLIDIEELNTLDVSFNRERYRDALMAAMHTFSQGPTIPAIKNIAETISHLPATITESVFQSWSLGSSILYPHGYEVLGPPPQLLQSKYNDGVLVDQEGQSIVLPAISNLKLEQGTFETWIRPNWDGLDNLAELKITPYKDGYLAPDLEVFIGALEYHPTYKLDEDTGKYYFNLDKDARVEGTPNKNKDGIYFYYDKDYSGLFNRWFIEIIDGYANDGYDGYDGVPDGYTTKNYSISLTTNGKFYDVKSLSNPKPSTSKITSGTNSLIFAVSSIYPNEGITFLADLPHYILDYGEKDNKNRISLFKDESGYLTFRVYDKLNTSYLVSTDVSSWKHGELHHLAISWKLNTKMARDEMHLFVDGFEVPNIIRYGDRITPYLHEKFRTVNPEEVVGAIPLNIVGSIDLSTIAGSNQVVSSINFSQYGIANGDALFIEEPGFEEAYTITSVNGNTLTLAVPMPLTITDGKFSANKTSFNVQTELDIYSNFTVSLVHTFTDGYSDLSTTQDSNILNSATTDFVGIGVVPGDLIRINDSRFEKHYTVLDVTSSTLLVNDDMPVSDTNLSFNMYHNEEEEIPGIRANIPAYELTKSTDGYFTNILSIRDKALANDLVLIRTLGLNHRRVRRKYYVWGSQANILKTKLPTPLSLDEVKVNKVILTPTSIGPSNSTLNSGVFDSNNIPVGLLSGNAGGRTLSVSIQGDNIDFTTSTTVVINGTVMTSGGAPIPSSTETLTFTEQGIKDTTKLFASVNYVVVHSKPINTSFGAALIEIKEKYPLTKIENAPLFGDPPPSPVVRYSYQVSIGSTLESDGYLAGDGYTVSDPNNFFSSNVVGNYLIIFSPAEIAGYYQIDGISEDHLSLHVVPKAGATQLPAFTDGYYQILNTTDARSGLQNGFFTFEHGVLPGEPFDLTEGWYELDYYTYLGIPFDMVHSDLHIGSDLNNHRQLHGFIDELQILNVKLTDTRVGETAPKTQRTITKEFNSLKESKSDVNTLVLTHFNEAPFTNESDIYISAEKYMLQSGQVINDNFTQSMSFIDSPLILDNSGVLDTKKEATIEFWVNPLFDTQNDPTERFYFDGYGSVVDEIVSANSTTINLKGSAAQVLSVKLAIPNNNTDYFAGGELSNNGNTILLHKALPNQNTPVIVSYLPKGLKGDRVSIFKDAVGYLNFIITANSTDYLVRAPIFWPRNTWHRVKASYTVNGGRTNDQMHLFIDGYERGDVLYGNGLLYGQHLVYGSSYSGPNNLRYDIRFKDPINKICIGSDFNQGKSAHCLMDNFRISNVSRPLYMPFGEAIDPNYSSNLDMVYPITEDLNTTLLLNFDTLVVKNTDFATLNDKNGTLSDFSVEVLDSFDIINDNTKVKTILEALIKNFKPAQSRAFIYYK